VFSFRRFLLTNAVLFLTFSMACAFAHNLQQMIALRAIQGFTGGVLIPMAFTLILTKLPASQRPIGMALFAITATFAPAIGPTIGGYLTENYGWQYIFFINLVPGTIMVAALFATLERRPMQLHLLKEGDWFGIAAMAIGLSALQTVLEEGNKDDWFGSPFIVRLAAIAAVALSLFVWIELTVKNPAVNLRLLSRRNFGLGTLANMLLGFALYGSVYLLPQYLGQAQGYNSEQIGAVMAWTGLPQLLLIPFVPMLMGRFDARYIVMLGLSVFGGSFLLNMHMSADYSGDQFWTPTSSVRGPGTGVGADEQHRHDRHHAGRGGRRVGHLQYAAQSRRRLRDGGACHVRNETRAVPFEHHWRAGQSLQRGSARQDRYDDQVLHVPRHQRSVGRAWAGHHRSWPNGQTSGADHGLQ
jgi:DHA2 family multidrug resistance protein